MRQAALADIPSGSPESPFARHSPDPPVAEPDAQFQARVDKLADQAHWCYETDRYAGARRIWEEVLSQAVERYGEEHWLVVEANIMLRHLDRAEALWKAENARFAELRQCDGKLRQLLEAGEYAAAKSATHETLSLCKELFGDDDPRYLNYLGGMRDICLATTDFRAARRWGEEALRLQETLRGCNHPAYGISCRMYGYVLLNLGVPEEADGFFRKAYDILWAAKGSYILEAQSCLKSVGECCLDRGNCDEAMKHLRHARGLLGRIPDAPAWKYGEIQTLLAQCECEQGRYKEALERLQQVAEVLDDSAPDKNSVAVRLGVQDELGHVYRHLGQVRKASQMIEKAFEVVKQRRWPASAILCQHGLAMLYAEMGDFARAAAAAQQALKLANRISAGKGLAVPMSLDVLGRVLVDAGKYAQAAECFQKGLQLLENIAPKRADVRASLLDHLGYAYLCAGGIDRAGPLLRQALELRSRRLPPGHLELNRSRFHLAVLHMAQGEFDQAEAMLAEVLRRYEQSIDTNNPDYLHALDAYAELLRRQGKRDEAQEVEQRISPILEYLKQQGCRVENLYPKPWPPTVSLPSSTDDM